nr:4'-phosphopantetheinyl transferase superfamily protein [Streptomonospora nanhaiensis]
MTCDLWWGDLTATSPDRLRALYGLLDADERQRHAAFRVPADKDRYALAHGLARLAVGRAAGIAPESVTFDHLRTPRQGKADPPGRGPRGKPRPSGPAEGWEISFSHSGDRVLLAMARGVQVGADVQEVRTVRMGVDSLLGQLLHEDERGHFTRLDPRQREADFFTYWSRKEALVKATGEGLAAATKVVVSPPGAPIAVHSWDTPNGPAPGHVQLLDVAAGDGYSASVAALTPRPLEISVRDTADLLKGLPKARPRTGLRGGTGLGPAKTRTAPATATRRTAPASQHRPGPSATR